MDDFIVPLSLFEIPKKLVLLDIPFCPKKEAFSK